MKKNFKAKKSALVGLLALGVIGVGAAGSLAYLSDSEQHTNIVTAGDVKMDLTESLWVENDAKDAVPNEVIPKNPVIENTGTNDEIVFIQVEVPVKNVTKIMANGSGDGDEGAKVKQDQEIFYFQKTVDAGKQANSFNLAGNGEEGWRLVTGISGNTSTGGVITTVDEGEPTEHKIATYTFAYNKKLEGSTDFDGSAQTSENKLTTSLFDVIQMKNVLETELTAGEAENIVVRAYGIQASDIIAVDGAAGTITTDGIISDANLATIWAIVGNQGSYGDGNITTAEPEANTNNELNLAGTSLTSAPEPDPEP